MIFPTLPGGWIRLVLWRHLLSVKSPDSLVAQVGRCEMNEAGDSREKEGCLMAEVGGCHSGELDFIPASDTKFVWGTANHLNQGCYFQPWRSIFPLHRSGFQFLHGFLCYNQAFSALLLCSCSREHINELSPLNSMPEPWPLPYGIFGTPKAQDRVDVSRRSEGTDCILQPMGDHLAHQSHYLFKFWEVSKIGFCSHSRGWSWCPLPSNSFVLSHGGSSMLISSTAWLLNVTGMLQISHMYTSRGGCSQGSGWNERFWP